MGSKNNPGDFDCYANAEPDEPMFILLGRDPAACTLVRQWADMRERDGMEPAKLAEARACADWLEQCARDLGKGDRVDRFALPEGDEDAARAWARSKWGGTFAGYPVEIDAFKAGAAHGRRQGEAERAELHERIRVEVDVHLAGAVKLHNRALAEAQALRDTLAHAYADTPGWRDDARALLAPPSPREPDTTPGRYPPGLRGRNREIEHAAQLAQARDRAERSGGDETPRCTTCDDRGEVQEGTGYANSEGGEEWRLVPCPTCSGPSEAGLLPSGLTPDQRGGDAPHADATSPEGERAMRARIKAKFGRITPDSRWAEGYRCGYEDRGGLTDDQRRDLVRGHPLHRAAVDGWNTASRERDRLRKLLREIVSATVAWCDELPDSATVEVGAFKRLGDLLVKARDLTALGEPVEEPPDGP